MRAIIVAVAFSVLPSSVFALTSSEGGHPVLYRTEHIARLHCPKDNVVWASTSSRMLYLPGDKHYGHTHGGFVCESDARRYGYIGPRSHA